MVMSDNYGQLHTEAEFTHDTFIMSKITRFLPITTESCAENDQKLYIIYPTCKENSSFLCTSIPLFFQTHCVMLFITHSSSFITH